MRRCFKILPYLVLICLYSTTAYAQKKKKAPPAKPAAKADITAKKKDTAVVITDDKKGKPSTPQPVLATKRVDTIIYIDPKTGKPMEAKPQPKPAVTNTRKPDTIIYVDNSKKPAPPPATPYRPIDTVIVIRNGTQKKEVLKNMPKEDIVKVEIVNEYCGCVKLDVTAQDTVRFQDYVNYSFSFKNNCKEKIYINSGSFGFVVATPQGVPLRTLRKLQFTKQYKYPDFVEVRPGEEYTFQFGDDPFFQYDLRQGWKYKFSFTYYNTTRKYNPSPRHTYLCNEFREKMIVIK
jgi:hypothetical protein